MTNLELILLTRTVVDIASVLERCAHMVQQNPGTGRPMLWRDYVQERRMRLNPRYRQR